MGQNNKDGLVKLCQSYLDYLRSATSTVATEKLIIALKKYGLVAHAEALFQFSEGNSVGSFVFPFPWSSVKCYLTEKPPVTAEPCDMWFDPYEISFMVRTVNPAGFGKGVIGWGSISPVYYWQYHVFQTLVKFEVRDDSFLQVNDLLASRPFGMDKWDYASNVYHEEAAAYAFWHGKWLTSNIRINAISEQMSDEQLNSLLPDGVGYWDSGFSGREDLRAAFKVNENGIVDKFVLNEWERIDEVGLRTAITDQVGLISSDVLPRETGNCLQLLNCSRNL